MRREESTYPADWLRIAEKGLKRVSRLLRDHDPEMIVKLRAEVH
jgi:hypothetical protein